MPLITLVCYLSRNFRFQAAFVIYGVIFLFRFLSFRFIFGFLLDVSCWMSPDSEVIWIFVAFLVMIEVVSDTNVE